MTSIATLRATNCSRLLYIAESVVAACGTKTAYLFQYKGDKVEEASCTAPREAENFAPWLPPGAALSATRAIYCVRKDGGYGVLLQAANAASAATEIVSGVADKVEEMHIFYQSILALQTASAVLFYFLDPSTGAASAMGSCVLPAWSDSRDVRVEVTSAECWSGAAERTVAVMCLSPERVYAAVVVCTSSSSAVVVRRTAEDGVPLPCASSVAKVMGWTVRWARQELLLLLLHSGPTTAGAEKTLATFSLQASGSSAAHPLLEKWVTTTDAAPAALRTATDVCCDGDGKHVWLCDTVTGPSVVLREIANAPSDEVVLAGTNANARLTVARGVPGMFVLAGRSLYVVRGTSHHVSSAEKANADGSAVRAAAAAVAGAEHEEPSMSDWLEKQAATRKAAEKVDKPEPQPKPAAPKSAPAAAPKPSSVSTSVLTSSSSAIKEKLLQYVLGTADSVAYVIRDSVYVRETSDSTGAARYHHDILSVIAETFAKDGEQHALATLRYAVVAESLHPYTVLALLQVRRDDVAPPAGLLLALATVLADKSTLQHGGLPRLPHFAAASAAFFATPGGPFVSELQKKRYTADLCAAAMAALANGGLGAARLLFAVADRAVTVLYGGRGSGDAVSSSSSSAEEQACESTIAEAVSLMRSFVEWSLSASSSIGLMTAHVGSPQTLTKEAALRDGQAHPIDTSRQVEIRPLQVTRLPKRTI